MDQSRFLYGPLRAAIWFRPLHFISSGISWVTHRAGGPDRRQSAACPRHGGVYDRDRIPCRHPEFEDAESTALGLLKALGKYRRAYLPAVFADLGCHGRRLLFPAPFTHPELVALVEKQFGVFLCDWVLLRRVCHRRGVFDPICDPFEALCEGKRSGCEI